MTQVEWMPTNPCRDCEAQIPCERCDALTIYKLNRKTLIDFLKYLTTPNSGSTKIYYPHHLRLMLKQLEEQK